MYQIVKEILQNTGDIYGKSFRNLLKNVFKIFALLVDFGFSVLKKNILKQAKQIFFIMN